MDVVSQTVRSKRLVIQDFQIEVKKDKPPMAKVWIKIDGVEYRAESVGTGPVDASINSILVAIKKSNNDPVKLTDYKVEINSSGTDSVVEVSMNLSNEKGKIIIANGTSPDIIQASINAFVNGYNSF